MLVEKTKKREALFWYKVNKGVNDENCCWLWTGAKNEKGYGWITVSIDGKQRFFFAHKVSYEWENGEIPKGSIVRHNCDTPLCVRPSHLLLGTNQDNSNDMVKRGRHVGNREIDEPTAVMIRMMRANGATNKELGMQFGLSPQHISNICTGIYWPNAGGPITRRFELPTETILQVLDDLKSMSQVRCAIKNRISLGSVQNIAQGKKKPVLKDGSPTLIKTVEGMAYHD